MKTFGIRYDALQEPVENLIKNHANLKTSSIYTVAEIGTAGAVTLRALHEIVKENRPDGHLTCGFDILQCAQDYIKELIVNFQGKPNVLKMTDLVQNPQLKLNEMYLFLMENPQEFIRDIQMVFDLVHIDGVHSKPFVIRDFECIEKKVKSGGYIFFHDSGDEEYGTDTQIDGNPIQVKDAIKELGLFDNQREGFKFIKTIPGSRVTKTGTMDGNSLTIIQKI